MILLVSFFEVVVFEAAVKREKVYNVLVPSVHILICILFTCIIMTIVFCASFVLTDARLRRPCCVFFSLWWISKTMFTLYIE